MNILWTQKACEHQRSSYIYIYTEKKERDDTAQYF